MNASEHLTGFFIFILNLFQYLLLILKRHCEDEGRGNLFVVSAIFHQIATSRKKRDSK